MQIRLNLERSDSAARRRSRERGDGTAHAADEIVAAGHGDAGSLGPASALEDFFHPAVARWFSAAFGAPTAVQAEAWRATASEQAALIAAPTGSGKTLAAFLGVINTLVERGLHAPLPDKVQVLYVSPLKALSNDVQKNLQVPLQGIRDQLVELGLPEVLIRDGVRTGDTPLSERERMRRQPPHILVTTPESLFILLTSDSGRRMLSEVQSVIIDELHALAGNKRGAHLALSLQRLDALCGRPPTRIGLSATVKPIEEIAQFLVDRPDAPVAIIDTGHQRARDLDLELPRSPLSAVMSGEVMGEVYDRLADLVNQHRTTLVFVNQRRMAERVARHLGERLGEVHVAAHHGSLSRAHRLKAEQRLKAGRLKVLVATSSLELGIDIGDVDLVCQIGSPRALNAFLQRVGRSGHAVRAIPKGRLFPLSLDDLLECAALLTAIQHGQLDRIRHIEAPLDVLAQQIVAEVSMAEWSCDALYTLFCGARPYAALKREDFDHVVRMLAEGYSTRRGRRGAYLHWDAVNHMLRSRKGAKITAVTNAGVIADQFDYDVVLMPEEARVGTVGEDFAFESIPGDVFQLGNMAYRVAKVETGKVYVEDAEGQAPNIPFWFGEAPSRTIELSTAVAQLTTAVERAIKLSLNLVEADESTENVSEIAETTAALDDASLAQAVSAGAAVLMVQFGLSELAARALSEYLSAAFFALSALPSLETVIIERFFDEVGDSHVVIHSPYGSRVNRAWGLALRKRFCRTFNFELQASALEDSIVLSLGPTHSFPLESIKDFLKAAQARDVLIQALLDAPMFGVRWRRDASVALAIPRIRNGRRAPPQFQRSDAEDLLTLVFPDQVACAENLSGPREVPDHPLVKQTIADCLHDTMDVEGLEALLSRIESGQVHVLARDLSAPSPLAHAILHAKPYAFLDDGEAEERRTRSVATAATLDLRAAASAGRLDPRAIERVREEAQPEIRSADELHDALVVYGYLTHAELSAIAADPRKITNWLEELSGQKRVASWKLPERNTFVSVAAERYHHFFAALALDGVIPMPDHPASGFAATQNQPVDGEVALRELIRSRLELWGPTTVEALLAPLKLSGRSAVQHADLADRIAFALSDLERQGIAIHGAFNAPQLDEWCDRSLLARIHRYTRNERRAMVQPVVPAQFMRFLLRWQGLTAIVVPDPTAPQQLLKPLSGTAKARRYQANKTKWTAALEAPARAQVNTMADITPYAAVAQASSSNAPELRGEGGILKVLEQLEGVCVPAAAWERAVLPLRVQGYRADELDRLCISGRIAWCRPRSEENHERKRGGPVASTPILFAPRETLGYWQAGTATEAQSAPTLSSRAQRLLDSLREYGASFFSELLQDSGLLQAEAEDALGELVSHGLVHCDSYAGLRALLKPADQRSRHAKRTRHGGGLAGLLSAHHDPALERAGRWSLVRTRPPARDAADQTAAESKLLHIAWTLLRRYGVVFRKLVEREEDLPPWRELHAVYRRLEARGEIAGGRFVSQFSGEQFALPYAATSLRSIAQEMEGSAVDESGVSDRSHQEWIVISGADPLNLVGVLTPGEKISRVTNNKILLEAGVPIAAMVGGDVKLLKPIDAVDPAGAKREWLIKTCLLRE